MIVQASGIAAAARRGDSGSKDVGDRPPDGGAHDWHGSLLMTMLVEVVDRRTPGQAAMARGKAHSLSSASASREDASTDMPATSNWPSAWHQLDDCRKLCDGEIGKRQRKIATVC